MGALVSGIIADLFGMKAAINAVAALTFISGLQVAIQMRETSSAYRAGIGLTAHPTVMK